MTPYLPDELQLVVTNIKDPAKLADLIASTEHLPRGEAGPPETLDVGARLQKRSVS